MKPILFFSRVFILVSVGHIHPSSHKITSLRLWYTNAIVNIHPFKRKNINPIQIHLPHIYIQAQTYTFWFSLEITDSTKSCFGAKSIYIDFLARIMFSSGISLAENLNVDLRAYISCTFPCITRNLLIVFFSSIHNSSVMSFSRTGP